LKQWSREQVMVGLKKLVPEINFISTTEEFGVSSGGIWTVGGKCWFFKELPVFDYDVEYGECLLEDSGYAYAHPKNKVKTMYVNGIHREIYSWLEERGWYPKWIDAETLFFWEIENE